MVFICSFFANANHCWEQIKSKWITEANLNGRYQYFVEILTTVLQRFNSMDMSEMILTSLFIPTARHIVFAHFQTNKFSFFYTRERLTRVMKINELCITPD